MIAICEEEGLTQAQFIESLLERELAERGKLDVKTSHSERFIVECQITDRLKKFLAGHAVRWQGTGSDEVSTRN